MNNFKDKRVYFVLEGLNAFACSYYFNYLFFFLRDAFNFSNRENLAVCALHGLIYAFASWQGGKLVEKIGRKKAMRIGFLGMSVALLAGGMYPKIGFLFVVLAGWTISMCLIWPSIESLISENETPTTLPDMVGLYNIVWAVCSALAYFVGGAIYENFGILSIFWVPPIIHLIQFSTLTIWQKNRSKNVPKIDTEKPSIQHQPEENVSEDEAKHFLRMAWIANIFAYVAMNTVLAVIPELARKHNLNPTETGLFCSIWLFVRFGAFILLWQWKGWHYKFGWLISAFVFLISGFIALLLGKNLWILVVAQVAFGWAVGLFYYSSLYYAMDVGEAGASHGGAHEAMIGVGIFLGPAIGAGALNFLPDKPNAAMWAVTALLFTAAAVLILLRLQNKKNFRR